MVAGPHHNPLVRFFEAIGRRSLYIFCVHTVELIAIPWYLFAAKYADRPVLGISLQYILSLGSIWLICALLQRRRDLIIKLFPARYITPRGTDFSECFGCGGAAVIG